MCKVIFLIAIMYFSGVPVSEAEELCGTKVCSGARSFCCKKGHEPRCILSEKSCTSDLCGNSHCSRGRPYCCEKEGYMPYCTSRSSLCFAGKCGSKLCKKSEPYCCNRKCSSSVCEVTTTITQTATTFPDKNKCGVDICTAALPYCCHQGSTSFCTAKETSCLVLQAHKCGNRLCGSSKPYCCNSEFCAESEDDCRSRRCGETTCAQKNAVCCRIGDLFTCTANAESCESFSCAKDSCVGAVPFCCNSTSNNFCTLDPKSCFGGAGTVDQTTTGSEIEISTSKPALEQTSATTSDQTTVPTPSSIFIEKSTVVQSKIKETSTSLPEAVKTTAKTTRRETSTSFKTEQLTDKQVDSKTSSDMTKLSAGSIVTTMPIVKTTTVSSTKAVTLSQNTTALFETVTANNNLPEQETDSTSSAQQLQHTTSSQLLSTTTRPATVAASSSAISIKTPISANPKFTPKAEGFRQGKDDSKSESSTTETKGDNEYLVDPNVSPKNNCVALNCLAFNEVCCGTGKDTYCAQSCINQSGGNLSMQIWIPVLIVVCGLIGLIAFAWLYAVKRRKKFFPVKKNYSVIRKTNSHSLAENPSVRAESYEYVANSKENGV